MKKFNWMSLFTLIPYIVAGIEHVHGDSVNGATKKQMAMDALGIATAAAQSSLPDQSKTIDAASTLASNMIDGVVAFNNAAGFFQSKPSSAPAAPVKK